ncbi:type IV pilus biogenesis/stability protein PilW [Pseudidiomarina tainanensis]|jgi:type IV pilus assembly protein PilF|uniref:Type IV pilus assembly protein PilF n=2 Tax=Pseudidiomarina TaxID=2800384 RepID=A0A1I6GTI1_9GAMM|nr:MULTISPECIES: type IV pilus biogenesis/stability protein PilW [Pseudidiomarina]RZQ56254.1 type IV pilus biogenesis/stability protein PilW [Pseudidiomarina tainanensis]SFR45436.1 type IV pilus assembly protein PilF [Pseudidiomarina maritima]
MRILLLVLFTVLATTGCVSQRTVDGKQQPAQQFNAEEASRTRLALGLQYLRSGNFEQAKANLERAREYTPDNADVYTGLAYYYQQVRDFKSAEAHYRKAIDLKPKDGDNYNNLGVLLCGQQRYNDADQMFRKAVAQPGYVKVASTYENAARCAAEQGDMANADRYYELALNHSGGGVTILENYATLLMQQKRYDKAATMIERRSNYPQLSAQYLWLEVQLAHVQNQKNKRQQFGDLLVQRFPASQQATDYLKLIK